MGSVENHHFPPRRLEKCSLCGLLRLTTFFFSLPFRLGHAGIGIF